jgi:hypothetical protein
LIPLVNQVRYGPGLILIAPGLLLIAVSTILLASAVWKSGTLPKWSGIPLAIAFLVYIPQLQGNPAFQPIRIVVGSLIFLSCTWLAWSMNKIARADLRSEQVSGH